MIADPVDALAVFRRGENVKAGLEPIGEAMRDLNRFMQLVIGGIQPVLNRLRTFEREIAVQFDHGVARFNQIGAVDLNFVVVLRVGKTRNYAERAESTEKSEKRSHRYTD